jgi:hypothetical protein
MSFLRHPFGCATYNYLLKGSCSRCPQNDQVGIPFPRTIDHLNERASAGYLGGERQTLQRGLRGRDERLHSGFAFSTIVVVTSLSPLIGSHSETTGCASMT